jgi:hypothetical protein
MKIVLNCFYRCFVVFGFILSLAYVNAAGAQIPVEHALRVLSKDTTIESLEKFAEQSSNSFKNQTVPNLSAEQREKLIEISAEVYNASRMKEIFVKAFALHLNSKDATGTELWLDSPVGKRFVLAEIASLKNNDSANLMRDGQASVLRASAARQQLIREFVTTVALLEMTESVLMSIAKGMHDGVAAVGPLPSVPMPGVTAQGSEVALQQMRQALRTFLDPMIFATSVNLYEKFTDREMRQYIGFYKSQSGQGYLSATRKSYNEMFTILSKELGAALAKSMQQQKS